MLSEIAVDMNVVVTCGSEEVAVMYAVLYSVDAGKMLVKVAVLYK